MLTISIAMYALGCVLAYCRYKAESIELTEEGYPHDQSDVWVIIGSWMVFALLVYIYFKNKSKYFLRF